MESLRTQGWRVRDVENKKHGINIFNMDLSDIGEPYLQALMSHSSIHEDCILQVMKIKDISSPQKKQSNVSTNRMLRLNLSDGNFTAVGLELNFIKDLSLNTAPGTKVKLFGKVDVLNGFLLLNPSNFKILGGHVEKLYSKWKIAKDLSNYERTTSSTNGAPPPFIPFNQKQQHIISKSKPRSLNKTDINIPDEPTQEQTMFNEHRKAAINEVTKPAQGKAFSNKKSHILNKNNLALANKKTDGLGQSNEIKEKKYFKDYQSKKVDEFFLEKLIKMGFSKYDSINALKDSNDDFEIALEKLLSKSTESNLKTYKENHNLSKSSNKKYNKKDLEENFAPSKQNNPATLFDFLETKMSDINILEEQQHNNSNKVHNNRYQNENRDKSQRVRQNHNNNKYPSKNYVDNQQKSSNKTYGQQNHRGNSNYQGSKSIGDNGASNKKTNFQKPNQNFSNGKQYNKPSNQTYANKGNTDNSNVDNYKANDKQNFRHSKLESQGKTTFKGIELKNVNPNKNYNKPPSTNPQSMPSKTTNPQFWRVGMECFAKYWEDGQFYPAIIKDIHPSAPTAVVQFMSYGNFEEVEFVNLKTVIQPVPMPKYQISNKNQNQMNNNRISHKEKPVQALYVPPPNRK